VKLMLKIAGGIIIALVLLTAGCAALIGSAAHEVQNESDAHAITQAQFRSLKPGMTQKRVVRLLGKPADDQEMHVSVSELGVSSNSSCVYYNERGELLTMYQVCFDEGKLSSKSRY
jgi:hypothetical protein